MRSSTRTAQPDSLLRCRPLRDQRRQGLRLLVLPQPRRQGGCRRAHSTATTPLGTGTTEYPNDDTRGDILILGTFTQGGATTNIRVFEWVGTGGDATANGTVAGPIGTLGDCVPGSANDSGCATVNNSEHPLALALRGEGRTSTDGFIPSGGFVEGGLDLTALGLEGCFASFVAETRTSPSRSTHSSKTSYSATSRTRSTTRITPRLSGGLRSTIGGTIPATLRTSNMTSGSIQVKDSAVIAISSNEHVRMASVEIPTLRTDTAGRTRYYTLCYARGRQRQSELQSRFRGRVR